MINDIKKRKSRKKKQEEVSDEEKEISDEEELKKTKREIRIDSAKTAYIAAVAAGTEIVENVSAITNEALQFIAGAIQTVMPILLGGIGLGVICIVSDRNKIKELSRKIAEKKNAGPRKDQNSGHRSTGHCDKTHGADRYADLSGNL